MMLCGDRKGTKIMREVLQLAAADARTVPWKNGQGSTRELALWPPGAVEHGAYDWRISRAEVAAGGPFSSFPGYERVLTVLLGPGLVLEHGERAPRARLRRLEPYRFDGDWPTTAELAGGPIQDLNVIARQGLVRARVQALALGARRTRETLEDPQAFLHVVAGKLGARVTGEERAFELLAGDSLWLRGLTGGEELDLVGLAGCELCLVSLG